MTECSDFAKNGDNPRPPGSPDEIKIVVVGEAGCGKSKFIETFCESAEVNDIYEADNSKIYCIRYSMSRIPRRIRLCKFFSLSEDPLEALIYHEDANGFVLMYAIDDPVSFERVADKWYACLESFIDGTPLILVGNKSDLRDNPLVIQRLASVNQVPVTEEQGKNLAREKAKIEKYFDCSSTLNENVKMAFETILAGGFANLLNNVCPSEDENNSGSELEGEY